MRFKDFYLNEEKPYVRICGLANGNKREERVKSDSKNGKRNLALTDRLKKIHDLAKEISWSDEFLFVKERKYVTESDIANKNICISDDAVQRALKTLCKKANVTYFPPHQIRFYGSMKMMNDNKDIYSVGHYLGHTNISTTTYYADKLNSERVYSS